MTDERSRSRQPADDVEYVMTIEQLREMHQARPFVPFDIHVADGRSLPVQHPENVAFAGAGRCIGVAREDGIIQIVDLLLVTSLEPRSNASARSKRPRSR